MKGYKQAALAGELRPGGGTKYTPVHTGAVLYAALWERIHFRILQYQIFKSGLKWMGS